MNNCLYNSGWIIRKVIISGQYIYIYMYIYIYSEYELVSVVDLNRCVCNSGWIKIKKSLWSLFQYTYFYSEYELVSVVDMNRCVHNSGWDKKVIVCGHAIYIYIYVLNVN